MKHGKVWGITQPIKANAYFEMHRLEIKAGYKCSMHEHKHKWNGFYLEKGNLIIRVWKNSYDLVDETFLVAGEYTEVEPGEVHQFECLVDSICFELYWAQFSHDDIIRQTVGGVIEG